MYPESLHSIFGFKVLRICEPDKNKSTAQLELPKIGRGSRAT